VIWPQLFDTVKWPLGEPHTGLAGPERLAAAVVPAETAGAVPDRMVPIEVATDEDPQAGTRTTPGLLVELEDDVVRGDDIVAAHHPLVFHAEDLLEIDVACTAQAGTLSPPGQSWA
jgi:hypothetical protein